MKKALLLSGGMDSVAVAFWQRPDVAITIDYGQIPAPGEIRAARAVSNALDIPHEVLRVDLQKFGSGDLAGTAALNISPVPEWWPFRNQALLTVAAMWGVSRNVDRLVIGALASDSIHADGRPEFFKAFNDLFAVQEGGIQIECPAINLNAVQLLLASHVPIEILSWAHSCHRSEYACGDCRRCNKHFESCRRFGYDPY